MKGELKKSVDIGVPFLLGGIVGAGVALFLAPKPGREVREDIKRFASTTKDRVNLAIDQGKELYEGGRSAVARAIEAGKSAYEAGKTAFVEEKEKWLHA